LAAGIAVAGFGLAKVFGGPGFSYFIRHFGVTEMFIFHGFLYLLLMLLAVAFIKKPETKRKNINLISWFSDLKSTIKLPGIWNYWLILFLNASAGLAIISSEVVFFNYSGITAFGIGFAISLCAITNTLGRLIVGWGSDFVKHKSNILGIITIISVISCLIGFSSPGAVSWLVLICNAGYGAMFAILPGALANRYGVENTSKALGIVFSSWAIAGLTGNQLTQLAMWLPVSYSPRIIIICTTILYLTATFFCTKVWISNDKEK
jgi:OFA family oxalate/formate antiporter-like MFS transporter